MASVTDKLKKTIEALDKKQLKRALSLTDTPKLDRQHGFVVEAANICLEDKGKCDKAIKVAHDKVKETTELPEDSTDLEGLEDYLIPREKYMEENAVKVAEVTAPAVAVAEEPVKPCDVCMIAGAVGQFGEISDGCDGEVRKELEVIARDNMTSSEKWMQTMADIAEKATCNKEAYVAVLSGLTEELEKMDSPILKNLEGE